jgi:RNA polymerase sigma-70 factor (ECF subfamily)
MDDQSETQEGDWVRRAREGDKEAFGMLVRRYMRPAYYAALGFLGRHDDALDASQEAFVRAYLAFDRFDPTRRFYAWYYRILKNLCLNMQRKRSSGALSFSEVFASPAEPVSEEPPSIDALERAELRRAVWEAIWRLETDDRELIVARDILGTPYSTLAELLEIPAGTVMSRLYYARRRLRDQLKGVL